MEIRKIEADIQVRGEGEETEFVISTAGMDRHGTVISPDGWDLSNFKRNPIMAFQHNTGSTDPDDIIGTWDIRVEGGQLLGKPIYEPEDLNPKADKIRRKVEHGTLRAVSVGFIPREWHWGDEKKGEKRDVLYLDKNELLEVSIVAVPSNPDALKRSYEDLRNDIPQPEEVVERGNSLDIVKARLIVNNLKQNA
jgi:HK97 family phage prohead protease